MVVWWIVIHYCMVALSSSSAHSSSSFCSPKVTGAQWPLGVAFVPKHKGARVADTSTLILQDRMWMGTGPPLTVFWPQTRELIYPATIKLVYFIALLVMSRHWDTSCSTAGNPTIKSLCGIYSYKVITVKLLVGWEPSSHLRLWNVVMYSRISISETLEQQKTQRCLFKGFKDCWHRKQVSRQSEQSTFRIRQQKKPLF